MYVQEKSYGHNLRLLTFCSKAGKKNSCERMHIHRGFPPYRLDIKSNLHYEVTIIVFNLIKFNLMPLSFYRESLTLANGNFGSRTHIG